MDSDRTFDSRHKVQYLTDDGTMFHRAVLPPITGQFPSLESFAINNVEHFHQRQMIESIASTSLHESSRSLRRLCLIERKGKINKLTLTGFELAFKISQIRPDGLRRGAHLLSKSPFQGIAQETQAELESVLSQATNE